MNRNTEDSERRTADENGSGAAKNWPISTMATQETEDCWC